MRPRLLVILVFVLLNRALVAQSTAQEPSESVPSVQSLLERIQRLEKRINELEDHERQNAQAQPDISASQVTSEKTPAEAGSMTMSSSSEDMHSNPAVREAEVHYPSLQIRGFADVDFSATDANETNSGFNLGQLVLHLASPLSSKVSYFGEISFTAQPDTYGVSVERSIKIRHYNDYFKMSFGKYHTPIGYWNTAFHHGAWLQTTITRPESVKFGGTLIPVHFVGLQTEGNIPSGDFGLSYSVGVGNGRWSILNKAGDDGDANSNRAWVVRVNAQPSKLYGLQLGGSVYRDLLTPTGGAIRREWIENAYVTWTKRRPEVLAEFTNVRHGDIQTDQVWNSQAYYVQMAYRLPWQENKWKPYFRFEHIHRPKSEPDWDVDDFVQSTLGIRYDITTYAAFKGEYRNTRRGVGEPSVNGAFFQTAFTF